MSDAAAIACLGRTAFAQAFGVFNTDADLQSHLDQTYVPEIIAREMESGCRYFIVLVDSVDAGFAKLRPGNTPSSIPGQNPIEVHQFYLLNQFHRRGLGTRLMNRSIEEARAMDADGIFLSVYEKADWAIQFYKSCGLGRVGSQVFRVGEDDQIDWLMYRAI